MRKTDTLSKHAVTLCRDKKRKNSKVAKYCIAQTGIHTYLMTVSTCIVFIVITDSQFCIEQNLKQLLMFGRPRGQIGWSRCETVSATAEHCAHSTVYRLAYCLINRQQSKSLTAYSTSSIFVSLNRFSWSKAAKKSETLFLLYDGCFQSPYHACNIFCTKKQRTGDVSLASQFHTSGSALAAKCSRLFTVAVATFVAELRHGPRLHGMFGASTQAVTASGWVHASAWSAGTVSVVLLQWLHLLDPLQRPQRRASIERRWGSVLRRISCTSSPAINGTLGITKVIT